MKVKFLGGAEEVGRLAIKFQDDSTRFMVDYGVVPEKPPQYPMPYEPVDGIFITHAHLDHIGALPVCYHGDRASLYTTTMTANSMEPLLNDSIKIMDLEGYPKRFDVTDIDTMFESLTAVHYEDTVQVGKYYATPYSRRPHTGVFHVAFREQQEDPCYWGSLYKGFKPPGRREACEG